MNCIKCDCKMRNLRWKVYEWYMCRLCNTKQRMANQDESFHMAISQADDDGVSVWWTEIPHDVLILYGEERQL